VRNRTEPETQHRRAVFGKVQVTSVVIVKREWRFMEGRWPHLSLSISYKDQQRNIGPEEKSKTFHIPNYPDLNKRAPYG